MTSNASRSRALAVYTRRAVFRNQLPDNEPRVYAKIADPNYDNAKLRMDLSAKIPALEKALERAKDRSAARGKSDPLLEHHIWRSSQVLSKAIEVSMTEPSKEFARTGISLQSALLMVNAAIDTLEQFSK